VNRQGFGVLVASLVVLGAAGGVAVASTGLPLTARVIVRGEFQGYTPEKPRSFKTAKAYLAGDTTISSGLRKVEVARLTHEGFEGDVTEFLDNTKDWGGPESGLSGVMKLGSTKSARIELTTELLTQEAEGATETFRVKAIPGAMGYGFSHSTGGGENVLFTDGPFLYIVGYGWYGSVVHNPRHAALIDAARTLYTRVGSHPTG
jgi:hypothetical protein